MVRFRFGWIWIAAVLFVMTLHPAVAQQVTPTPAPVQPSVASSSEWRIVQELSAAVQNLSTSDASTTNATTIMFGIILALLIAAVLVFLWKVAPPLIKQLADAAERERQANELRVRWAEVLERMSAQQSEFSTRKEDDHRTDGAVDLINQHTDEKTEPLVEAVDNILKLLTADKATRDKRDGNFDQKLDEAIRELRQLKTAVMKGGTGELDPALVPDTDPARAVREVKAMPDAT